MKRREFISKWTRIALLSGMAGVAGYLALTGRVTGNAGCVKHIPCKNCAAFQTCSIRKTDNKRSYGR
jgi:hypothetical protein